MSTTPGGPSRAQRFRCVLVGVIPPVLTGVGALLLLSAWRTELPDRLASHWGKGGVDGTSSLFGAIVMVIIACVVGVVVNVVGVLWLRDPRLIRALLSVVNPLVVIIAGIVPAVASAQRGVIDVSAVATPVVPILVLFGVAALTAAVSAALIGSWPVEREHTDTSGDRLPVGNLAAAERFQWHRRVGLSWPMVIIVGATCVVLVVSAAISGLWWLMAIMAVVAVLSVAFGAVGVTVDRSRVVIRSVLRWPAIDIAMADILRAEVVTVHALRDFGGYGRRLAFRGPAQGSWGFVTRSGEALMVTRTDGRRDLVVVDDAATAAGLINAVVAQ